MQYYLGWLLIQPNSNPICGLYGVRLKQHAKGWIDKNVAKFLYAPDITNGATICTLGIAAWFCSISDEK